MEEKSERDEFSEFQTDELPAYERLQALASRQSYSASQKTPEIKTSADPSSGRRRTAHSRRTSLEENRRKENRRKANGRKANGLPGNRRKNRKNRKKRHPKLRLILLFLALFFLTALLVFALMIQKTLNRMHRVARTPQDIIDAAHETFDRDTDAADTISDTDIDTDGIVAMKDNEIKNILLIGQDLRSKDEVERARSDTMILCSINTRNNSISLTSLMRDLYVDIPGYSNNKLNASYFFGGMQLLDDTIRNNLGVEIDANLIVDFDGFLKAMTKVGNLNMELTAEEAEYLNSHNYYGSPADEVLEDANWNLKEGINSLTPSQTLAYARIRYVGNSDYERTKRQRRILLAAFEKIKGGSLVQMVRFANDLFPCFTTDMDQPTFLGFVKTVVEHDMKNISDYRIPQEGTYTNEIINGMDVLYADLGQNSRALQEMITGEKDGTSAGSSTNPAMESY